MAIDLDVVTRLNKSTAREAAREAQQYFERAGRDSGEDFGDNFSKALSSKTPEIQKAFDKVTSASGKLIAEQEKLNDLQDKSTTTRSQLVVQSERVAKAYRDEESALRSVNKLLSDHEESLRSHGTAFNLLENSAQSATSQLAEFGGTVRGLGSAAGPIAIAGIGQALAEVATVAASAAQAVIVLPALLGAAGAAFGTLKIATLGFSDALDAIRDPKKFSEALAGLSPDAQQAALSIQALLPSFDQLKNATQDALFDGLGGQINLLANQYLPTIQSLTTGIAGSFNQMLGGVTNQLLTPETQASLQTFAANVTRAFQALAPSLGSVTSAFADLMSAGSGALPQIADSASRAAAAFSGFISAANQSGQLQQWLSNGLDTLNQIGGSAGRFVAAFMSLAPIGDRVMPEVVDALNATADALPGIVSFAANAGNSFKDWESTMKGIGPIASGLGWAFEQINRPIQDIDRSLRQLVTPLSAIGDIVDSIRWFFDPGGRDDAVHRAQNQLDDAVRDRKLFGDTGVPGYAGGSGSFDNATAGIPGVPLGGLSSPVVGLGAGVSLSPKVGGGWKPVNPLAYTVPKGAGSGGTAPHIDPSQYMMGDPLAGAPGIVPGADPDAIFAADSKLITATHNMEQKKLALQVLEAKGNATQQELLTAKNDLQEQERALYSAQSDDIRARTEQMKQSTTELQSVFAPLDQDFGLSKGLPGIVENLTKLAGNFAIGGAIRSSPAWQNGVLASAGGAIGSPSGASGGALFGGRGTGYSDAALLANVPAGRYAQTQNADLTKGLGDCSSAVEDLVNIMQGQPTAGRQMSTGNAADWLTSRGFQPGSAPGAFNVGFNDHHMQATLPGGTPFNWGGDSSAAQGGVGGSGAFDPAFTSHYFLPQAATPSSMGPAPLGGGVGPAWGPSGTSLPFGIGGGPVSGGMPQSLPGAPGPGVGGAAYSGLQSMAPPASPGGGGGAGGGGGLLGAAASAFPGGQQGAALAMRGVQFAGQAASIGVSGLLETILPHDSPLAGNSWLGKLAGGFSGARPAAPNAAGQSAPPQQGGQGQGDPGNTHNGPMVNIEHMSNGGGDGQGVANDIARNQYTMYQAGGPR